MILTMHPEGLTIGPLRCLRISSSHESNASLLPPLQPQQLLLHLLCHRGSGRLHSKLPRSLQPYDMPAQQGWLPNASPAPYSRQPLPQPSPVSPLLKPSSPPQHSAEPQPRARPLRQRSARRERPQVRKDVVSRCRWCSRAVIITTVKCIFENLHRERGYDLES